MIASALRRLGIFLGDKADGAVMEDTEIARLIESGDTKGLERLIASRNERHQIWGFKRPSAYETIQSYEAKFRNLHYVVIFRDPLAIAIRNSVSMRMNVIDGLEKASRQSAELVTFVKTLARPALLVSYEKASIDPPGLVTELVQYLGLEPTEEALADTVRNISANQSAYLLSSRIIYEGSIDRMSRTSGIHGWARIVGANRHVTVNLCVGGRILAVTVADRFRKDLEQAGKNDGHCGFVFSYPDGEISSSDITIQVAGSNFVLPRSKTA